MHQACRICCAAFVISLVACAGHKPIKAIRNSASSDSTEPIKLAIVEKGKDEGILYQYYDLCNVGDTRLKSDRLQEKFRGKHFKEKVPGVTGTFTKVYRNPFLAVTDSSEADMLLLIEVQDISFTIDELSKGEKASQVAKLILSGPLVQPEAYKNSIILECTLIDRSTQSSIYHFQAQAIQGKGLWAGGSDFAYLIENVTNELIVKILAD